MIAKLEFNMDDLDERRAFRRHVFTLDMYCMLVKIQQHIRDWHIDNAEAFHTLRMIQDELREIDIDGMD